MQTVANPQKLCSQVLTILGDYINGRLPRLHRVGWEFKSLIAHQNFNHGYYPNNRT